MHGQWRWPILIAAVVLLVLGGVWQAFKPVAEGERYAAKPPGWDSPAGKCVVCHSLEKGGLTKVAPNLWGIVGAPKGRTRGYGYSLALAHAGGVWTIPELNAYLIAPGQFLPGTTKTIAGVPDAAERARIIAFLATLKD